MDNQIRYRLHAKARKEGYTLDSYTHTIYVPHTDIEARGAALRLMK